MQLTKTRKSVLLALFIGMETVLMVTPLGFIPIGPIKATTLHIPVIVISILLGVKEGMILGFYFGLCSLVMSTFNPTPFSFCFSPFYSIGEVSGNFCSVLIALVPRITLGFVSGTLFHVLQEKMKDTNSILLSSLISTILHTAMVMGGIYLFFGREYAAISGFAYETFLNIIKLTICTNGLLEAFMAGFMTLAIYKALQKIK